MERREGRIQGGQGQPANRAAPAGGTDQLVDGELRRLRRITDRKTIHRLAQFALAVISILVAKLIDWSNRWSPAPSPIR